MEPVWIVWARELQAIAQTGLTFAENGYDRERYMAIRSLAARMMVHYSAADLTRVEAHRRLRAGHARQAVHKYAERAGFVDG